MYSILYGMYKKLNEHSLVFPAVHIVGLPSKVRNARSHHGAQEEHVQSELHSRCEASVVGDSETRSTRLTRSTRAPRTRQRHSRVREQLLYELIAYTRGLVEDEWLRFPYNEPVLGIRRSELGKPRHRVADLTNTRLLFPRLFRFSGSRAELGFHVRVARAFKARAQPFFYDTQSTYIRPHDLRAPGCENGVRVGAPEHALPRTFRLPPRTSVGAPSQRKKELHRPASKPGRCRARVLDLEVLPSGRVPRDGGVIEREVAPLRCV